MINLTDVNNNTTIAEMLFQNCNDLPKDFERKVMQSGLQSIIDSEVSAIKKNHQGAKEDVQIKRTREVRRTTCYGQVSLKVPYFKNFEYYPSFLEKYQRRDRQTNSLVASMAACCGSTRDIEDWCIRNGIPGVSRSTVSREARKDVEMVERFNSRDLSGENILEIKVDAMYVNVRMPGLSGGHYRKVALVRVLGYSADTGKIRHLMLKACPGETAESVRLVLRELKERNLKTPPIVTSDSGSGIVKACRAEFPYAISNICLFHKEKGIFATLPRSADPDFRKRVGEVLQAQSDEEAQKMVKQLKADFDDSCYKVPIGKLESAMGKGTCNRLTPDEKILKKIRTTSQLENMNGITRRRIGSIRCFPSVDSLETYCVRHCLLLEERWDRNFREDDPELPDIESLSALKEELELKQESIFKAAGETMEKHWDESGARLDGKEFKLLVTNIVHVPIMDPQGVALTVPALQVFGDDGTGHRLLRAFVLREISEMEIRKMLLSLRECGLDTFKWRQLIALPFGEPELKAAVRSVFPSCRVQCGHDSFKKMLLVFVPKTYQEDVECWLDLAFTCKDRSKAAELLSILKDVLEMHLLKEAVGMLKDAMEELLALLEEGLVFNKSGYVDLGRFGLGTGSIFPYWSAPSRKPNPLGKALDLMYAGIYEKTWKSLLT